MRFLLLIFCDNETRRRQKREVKQLKKVYLIVVLTMCMLLMSIPAFAAPSDDSNSIKFGMRGDNVQMLQKLLSEKGFYVGEVDGVFGKLTLKGVKEFQSSSGLTVDGIANKETLLHLGRASTMEFNPSRASRSMIMNASAYSAYDDGNGQYTSGGTFLRKGIIAVDPSIIPLGTRVYVAGYGYAIADDTGGSIRGNKIDLAYDSHSEAIQFGRRNVTVYLLD